ncbi:MAG: RluA family pseudouridine synthase [Flavobacteriales bacterium]|nr:RluA family pseudouridine synthase [Flavobacteriales bacterium]
MMDNSTFQQAIRSVSFPIPGSNLERVEYKLSVKKKYEGLNIIDFFCYAVPRSTPEHWREKVVTGNLKVNNHPVSPDYTVSAGDLTSHISEPRTEPDVNINIDLIYACPDFWVLNKPSPLPMHASGRFVRNTLIHILELAFPDEDFKMIHRIDANTTGIVVVGKNREAANFLRQQFENKSIRKEYLALVEGVVTNDQMNLLQSIGQEVVSGGGRKIDTTGKKAETGIEVLERRENETLLKVTPLTGRTNQIRLHLAESGHPIVGDLGHKNPKYFENNPFTYDDDSLFLHAYKITLQHPGNKEDMTFVAPVPEKFNWN